MKNLAFIFNPSRFLLLVSFVLAFQSGFTQNRFSGTFNYPASKFAGGYITLNWRATASVETIDKKLYISINNRDVSVASGSDYKYAGKLYPWNETSPYRSAFENYTESYKIKVKDSKGKTYEAIAEYNAQGNPVDIYPFAYFSNFPNRTVSSSDFIIISCELVWSNQRADAKLERYLMDKENKNKTSTLPQNNGLNSPTDINKSSGSAINSSKNPSTSTTNSKVSTSTSVPSNKSSTTTNTKNSENAQSSSTSKAVVSSSSIGANNSINAAETKRLANQKAEDEARIEQEKLRQKQADYDKWKAEAGKQQAMTDAAEAGLVGILLFTFGEWIYNDKMGKVDPSFSFLRTKKDAQFGAGIDYGYSLSSYPLLFASNKSSMSGGVLTNEREVQAKNPFVVNFEPSFKMGAENNKYGGFGYATVKLGISPIFDASNFSFQFGGRIYGGINWAKFYIDYGRGSRKFTKSIKDVEENGSGKSKTSISKFEYGVRFTASPKDDLRRSHIYFGIISEKNKQEKNNGVVNPKTGTLAFTFLIPKNSGFSIQWNKEHTFKVYTNIYPKFVFAGAIDATSGELATSFKTTPAGTFFEFGFVRAVNWWIN